MAGITLAWLTGTAIIVWRSVTKNRRPPVPGELLGSAGFFALTALLAEYPPARTTATLLAWGVVLAAYLEAPLVTAPSTAAAPAKTAAPAASTGSGTVGTGGVRIVGV